MADDIQPTTSDSTEQQLPVGEGQNGTAPAGGTPQTPPPVQQPPAPTPEQVQQSLDQAQANRDKQLDFHPAVTAAHVARKVGEAIAGGPKVTTTIDPNTGEITRTKQPLSTKEILTGAIANILGGLSQAGNAYAASHEHRAPPPPQPLPTQVAQQQQAQQSEEDFDRIQNQKVRQAKVLTANMEAQRLSWALRHESNDALDQNVALHKDDLNNYNKSGIVEASHIPSSQLLKKGYDLSKFNPIPDGHVPAIGPDGKQVVNQEGVPVDELTYSVINGTSQVPFSQDSYDKFTKYGLMKGKSDYKLPETAMVTAATLANMNYQVGLVDQTQRELDEVLGTDKVDLASEIKKNPSLMDAIQKFHNDGASSDPVVQLQNVATKHPDAAGVMTNLFGGQKALGEYAAKNQAPPDKMDENIARQITTDPRTDKSSPAYKAASTFLSSQQKDKEGTPKAQQDLINSKLTGEEKQLQIDKLKKDVDQGDWGDTGLRGDEYLNSLKPGQQDLIRSLGTGHVALSRLDYLVTKKPEVLEAVTRAFPDFDSSKAQGYTNVVKEFTSTKNGTAGAQLNAGATALKHMAELKDLNTLESRVPGTADYNRYNNKLDTLTGELATFYNLPKTDKSIQSMTSTLGAFLNRDAAIKTQAQSMGDKFDSLGQTWKNAAPSKAYEAPMPYIDDKAKQARSKLDPQYAKRMDAENADFAASAPKQQPKPDKQATLQSITMPGGGHPADIAYLKDGTPIVWSGKAGEGWINLSTGKPQQ